MKQTGFIAFFKRIFFAIFGIATVVYVFGIFLLLLLGSSRMEWVDCHGYGNGNLHEISTNGQKVIVFRLDDYWNTNGVYRITPHACINLGNDGSAELFVAKRLSCGELFVSRKFQFQFPIDREIKNMTIISLPSVFAPKKSNETLELEFLISKLDETGKCVPIRAKIVFKAKKLFAFPSV